MNWRSVFLSLIGTLLIFSKILLAQGSLQPEWLITRLSPGTNQDSQAWGVDVDNNGYIYWATNQIIPGQGFDILLYKLDEDSNEVWASPTIYGGNLNQQCFIVTVSENRAYVAGREVLVPPVSDMLIFAVDITSGDTLWSTIWDQGYGYEEVDGIMAGSDGIYVSGWTTGDTTGYDIALLKLDFDGNIIMTSTWGTALHDHQDGHAVMDDSVIYVAGLYGSPNGAFNGKSLLVKFSRDSLSYLDHTTFGGNGPWPNLENVLGMASDGTYLYLVGVTTVSFNNVDIYVAKYDKNLNQLWYELWGGAGQESARGITVADNGTIYIGGNTSSFGIGGDVALLSYSSGGNFLGYKIWGGSNEEGTQDIRAAGNYLYLTGKSQSLHPLQYWAAYLMKVRIDSATAINYHQKEISGFILGQNYPNPFNPATEIQFTVAEGGYVELKIYDLQGREVKTLVNERKTAGTYTVQWDGTNDAGQPVSSGVYLYRLQAGDPSAGSGQSYTAVRKMLLVR